MDGPDLCGGCGDVRRGQTPGWFEVAIDWHSDPEPETQGFCSFECLCAWAAPRVTDTMTLRARPAVRVTRSPHHECLNLFLTTYGGLALLCEDCGTCLYECQE